MHNVDVIFQLQFFSVIKKFDHWIRSLDDTYITTEVGILIFKAYMNQAIIC